MDHPDTASNDGAAETVSLRRAARAWALACLPQCAADVRAWRRTGRLSEHAVLRRLAAMLEPITESDDALQLAEQLVVDLCLEQVAVHGR